MQGDNEQLIVKLAREAFEAEHGKDADLEWIAASAERTAVMRERMRIVWRRQAEEDLRIADAKPLAMGSVADIMGELERGERKRVFPSVFEYRSASGHDECLLTAGETTIWFGEPGSMKSTLLVWAATEEARKGRRTVFLDYEGSEDTLAQTLLQFGLEPEYRELITRVPAQLLLPDHVQALCELKPSLVIVDSLDHAIVTQGYVSEGDGGARQTQQAHSELWAPLAASGAAVVLVDHPSKNGTASGPTGSLRKMSIVRVAYEIKAVEALNSNGDDPQPGTADIVCAKNNMPAGPRRGGVITTVELRPKFVREAVANPIVVTAGPPVEHRDGEGGGQDGGRRDGATLERQRRLVDAMRDRGLWGIGSRRLVGMLGGAYPHSHTTLVRDLGDCEGEGWVAKAAIGWSGGSAIVPITTLDKPEF